MEVIDSKLYVTIYIIFDLEIRLIKLYTNKQGTFKAKNVNKYNRIIRKKDLVIEMEYTITRTKCIKTTYGNRLVITIHFTCEIIDLCAPKLLVSKQLILKRN